MINCLSSSASAFIFLLSLFLLLHFVSSANSANAITPIPMELLNPRLTEFRRIDSSGDDQITFSEFLLSDRPWMETMSRRFHSIDANSDGKVTRKEFETYFRGKDEEQDRERNHQADSFFKQLTLNNPGSEFSGTEPPALNCHGPYRGSPQTYHASRTVTVGPIVEREQEGDAQNGSSRMRYFTAGSRKFAAITHGTGLFPQSLSSSAELSAPLAHEFDRHHFHNSFPHHAQFLLPTSTAILGSSHHGRPTLEQQHVTSVPAQTAIQQEKTLP